jgi:hypothetical protein
VIKTGNGSSDFGVCHAIQTNLDHINQGQKRRNRGKNGGFIPGRD